LIYLERIPAAPLSQFVRVIWYASTDQVAHGQERVLPNGCVQVILSLARDFLLDCPESEPVRMTSPALIVGARSVYEIIDRSDFACIIGIIFEPGGFSRFAADAVDQFSNRNVALEDIWGPGAQRLRDRLREIAAPVDCMRCIEEFLRNRLLSLAMPRSATRHAAVDFALGAFRRAPALSTVREVARSTGWSERRFSQVFREEVGLSPKVWCRIQRFQRVVRQLHTGAELAWSELALDCGFYDQSHFANEFKAFSGIDATTYAARRTQWANHISV